MLIFDGYAKQNQLTATKIRYFSRHNTDNEIYLYIFI